MHPSVYLLVVLGLFLSFALIVDHVKLKHVAEFIMILLGMISAALLLFLCCQVIFKKKVQPVTSAREREGEQTDRNDDVENQNQSITGARAPLSLLSVTELMNRINEHLSHPHSSSLSITNPPTYRTAVLHSALIRFQKRKFQEEVPPTYLTYQEPSASDAPPSYHK